MKDWASLPLRISLGIIFVAHGLQKVFGAFGGPGIEGFSQMLSGLGFQPALVWAYVAALVELLGGLCLIAGFLTRISALLIFVLISVATFKVHLANGLFMSKGGIEYNLVILSACIALLILGPGKLSVNKKL